MTVAPTWSIVEDRKWVHAVRLACTKRATPCRPDLFGPAPANRSLHRSRPTAMGRRSVTTTDHVRCVALNECNQATRRGPSHMARSESRTASCLVSIVHTLPVHDKALAMPS
jgi:hypothetical protein